MDGQRPDDLEKSLAVVTEHTTLRKVPISEAAARHLIAWDTDQRVRALHESGHVILATVLGIPVKTADIKGHRFAYTETGEIDDDQPTVRTGSQLRDRIVMRLGGLAAEKLIIGDGTDGSDDDMNYATLIAMNLVNCGLDPRAPFISSEGLLRGRLPDRIGDAIGEAILLTLSEARDRADALALEHREHIVAFAQRLHDARRLTDDALIDAIRETRPA